ncbi:MAG: hypothetical protein R6V03_02160 [Kiritimatiellia bacterium]
MKHLLFIITAWAAVFAGQSPGAPDTDERDARKADTRGVIPRLKQAPAVDGKIQDAEWRDAFVYNGVLYEQTLNLFPRNVKWMIGWTEAGFYVGSSTRLMEGESPRSETRDGAMKNLAADDSMELLVYDDNRRSSVRLVINPAGTWAVHRRVDGSDAAGDGGIRARALLTDDVLEFEAHVPFKALGHEGPGTRWRILPARNFRTGTNITAPLPYAHLGFLGRRGRVPVFTLAEDLPFIQLDRVQEALYAGRPLARLCFVNPAGGETAVKASLRIHRGKEVIGSADKTISLPPNGRQPVSLAAECEPAIDPETEDEYRWELDVTGPGKNELFHTHFTWNPTENRAWLGDKLPGWQKGEERVVTIDPSEPVPLPFQRFMKQYKDLPEDHRLQITTRRTIVPGKGYMVDSVQHITPVGPDGRKNGVQTFYRVGYMLEHSITWKDGVRHGPETFYARDGRRMYAQKVVPWVKGEVRGVQRVFHPNGEVLAETTYVDGRPSGISRRYDDEGRLVRVTPYADGLRHGMSVDYYPGPPQRVKREVPYEKGLINGVVVDYWKNGRIKRKRPFKQDVLHGVEERCNEKGELVSKRRWIDGNVD